MSKTGNKTIVLPASTTINLESRIINTNSNVTIIGNGTQLKGAGLQFQNGSNAIIYNLIVRPGNNASAGNLDDNDALSFVNWDGAIVKNCCFGWSTDENIGVSNSQNISFEDNIIHEGLLNGGHSSGEHSMGCLVSEGSTNISFFRNLFAHHGDRSPGLSVETNAMNVEWINNVVYNQRSNVGWLAPIDDLIQINLIGNVYKRGLSTLSGSHRDSGFWAYTDLASATLVQATVDGVKIYTESNIAENSADYLLYYDPLPDNGFSVTYPSEEVTELNLSGNMPVLSSNILNSILANSGTLPKDSHQIRIINDVINNTGTLIDNPSEVGG